MVEQSKKKMLLKTEERKCFQKNSFDSLIGVYFSHTVRVRREKSSTRKNKTAYKKKALQKTYTITYCLLQRKYDFLLIPIAVFCEMWVES